MPNVMIDSGGAYGDQGVTLPALAALRERYDQIFISGKHWVAEALTGTGWFDGMVVKPDDFDKWEIDAKRRFLNYSTRDMEFDKALTTTGCIPGRLNWHKGINEEVDTFSPEKKRELNADKNYFDEMSLWLGCPEAVGKRPQTMVSVQEKRILAEFRGDYGIPVDAFLLGWQFTGSNAVKWYPFFYDVIQRNIMTRFPEVYVVGMGDLKKEFRWDKKYHGGRFINMYDLITFRQAYLLTGIFDCFVTPDTGVYIFSQCFPETPKILLSTLVDGKNVACGDDTTIIQSAADCSPCYVISDERGCKKDGNKPWAYCMGKIHPQRVIDAIENEIINWRKN